MKYIGPFFRMNTLSEKEIESQLFFLSKEVLKHIILESRCGIIASTKNFKKYLPNNDIDILKDFSPLLAVYKKGKPKLSSNKHFNAWPEEEMKKELNCCSNSLMTYCILSLTEYYKKFKVLKNHNYSIYNIYKTLAKLQLDLYSKYLRNGDGVFVDKKNSSNTSYEISLQDADGKFKLSDQAFMMNSYYYYWFICTEDKDRDTYKNFALEMLDVFLNFKEKLYEVNFEECLNLCLAFNSLYKINKNDKLCSLIIDLTDYILDKYDEKNYIFDNIELSCLLAINLHLSYKNTNIEYFKESFLNISDRHKKLFNPNKNVFIKSVDKKEVKYSSTEMISFIINMLLLNDFDSENILENRSMLSSLYKTSIINSGILSSWPKAPSLDENDRYIDLTLNSEDLLDESMFIPPNLQTPESIGLASVFVKSATFSNKKNTFIKSKMSFDSNKNFFIYFLITLSLKDKVMKYLFKNNRDTKNDSNECKNNISPPEQ